MNELPLANLIHAPLIGDPFIRFLSDCRGKTVHFFPHSGNAGDGFICHATYTLFRAFEIDFITHRQSETVDGQLVLIGGGGNLIEGRYNEVADLIQKLAKTNKVVLLPHTILGFSEILKRTHENLTVFCREPTSFQLAIANGANPNQTHLSHDAVFFLNNNYFADFLSEGHGTLQAMRTDGESLNSVPLEPGNIDISLSWNGEFWTSPELCRHVSASLAAYISPYAMVKTDRLHISILSAFLDKQVYLLPNAYFKNKAIYEHSIKPRFSGVQFKQTSAAPELPTGFERTNQLTRVAAIETMTKDIVRLPSARAAGANRPEPDRSILLDRIDKFEQRFSGMSLQLAELTDAMKRGQEVNFDAASIIQRGACNNLIAWVLQRHNLLLLLRMSPEDRIACLLEQASIFGVSDLITDSFSHWLCRRRTLLGLLRRSHSRGKIAVFESLEIFSDSQAPTSGRVLKSKHNPKASQRSRLVEERPLPGPVIWAPSGVTIPPAYQARLRALLDDAGLKNTFNAMQAIEPDIMDLASITRFIMPSFSQGDGMPAAHLEVQRRLPQTHYDSIICIPCIRTGGADLVAGLLASALLRIRPAERVLVLQTDLPHFERANWFPAAADRVDISDLVKGLDPSVAENLLRLIFRGLTARRVFNVNSRLCWNTMRTYGANLKATLFNYAYMFCWDQTASGRRVGYPSEFFADTARNVTAFLTDTAYLRNELTKMYRLPPAASDRIVPIYTPAQTDIKLPSVARSVYERAEPGSRRLVLWAGRLDRQKRFELVMEIAQRMPETEFRCWGNSVLDAGPNLTKLPENVTMQGSFDNFDDLPLQDAGVWLFTSLWEGMPTTIIELATRGVAVVASAVGGVPELIQPETGWLVPGDAKAEDYVAAIRQALSSPEEAMRRAEALQRRVASVYTEAEYDNSLDVLLKQEGVS